MQGRGAASHWGHHIVFLPNRSDIDLSTSIFGGLSNELKDHEVCQLKLSSAYELVFYQVITSSMSGKVLILIVTPPDTCLCPRRAISIL